MAKLHIRVVTGTWDAFKRCAPAMQTRVVHLPGAVS